MSNLIICYSRRGENYVNGSIRKLERGNSEICAAFIREAVGGDLFMIETVRPYAEDYMTCIDQAKEELRRGERPELKEYLESAEGYDNVFVCGPCWWGTFPCAVFSQLEKLDLSGKKLLPLMTHEGSGLGSCLRDLEKSCPGARIMPGLAIHGADAAQSGSRVAQWAREQTK